MLRFFVMTGVFSVAVSPGVVGRVVVVGEKEALFRFLCACASEQRGRQLSILVATPVQTTGLVDLHGFALRCGWQACDTDCTEAGLLDIIRDFRPHLLVSVLFPRKISPAVLQSVQYAINFHPSLLPEHRGSLTQFWAVFDGDAASGVTCHHMVAALDEGPVIDRESCELSDSETAFSLNRKLMTCFEVLASRIMKIYFRTGEIPAGQPQPPPTTPYHFRKFPNDGFIDCSWSDAMIDRFIRGMFVPPYVGAKVKTSDGREYAISTLADYHEVLARLAQ